MTGIRGRYPPKRIKMLIEANEHKRQREAEAAAREYVTDRSEAVDPSGTVLHDPELKSGGYRDSGVADERAIGGSQDHSTKVPTDELRGPKPMQPIDTVSSVDTAPMIPTFVLSAEQNVHAAEGDLVAPEGNIESDVPAVVLPSAGQSQSNVTYPPAEVTSATKSSTGTQTSPRDNTDVEMNDSSQEGSFDDSVTSFWAEHVTRVSLCVGMPLFTHCDSDFHLLFTFYVWIGKSTFQDLLLLCSSLDAGYVAVRILFIPTINRNLPSLNFNKFIDFAPKTPHCDIRKVSGKTVVRENQCIPKHEVSNKVFSRLLQAAFSLVLRTALLIKSWTFLCSKCIDTV